jgi:arginine decarboxylase
MLNFIPKKFFITSGGAQDKESVLNAFDRALRKGRITQCNLVSVSSILPAEAEEVDPVDIVPGTITFCVLARMDGQSGDRIGAGIGYGTLEGKDKRYGIVAEQHGYSSAKYMREKLVLKLQRMAKIRNMKLVSYRTKVESLEVDEDYFGSVIVALVYLFEL